MDFAGSPADLIIRVDPSILQPLMIPFFMIMDGEVFQGSFQGLPAKEDHPVEAFGFHGSHISFEMGVQIRASRWQKEDFDVGKVVNVCAERQELGVPVNNNVAGVFQESVFAVGEISGHLAAPFSVWTLSDPGDLDLSGFQTHDDQDVEGDQAVLGPYFHGGEVDGGDGVPFLGDEPTVASVNRTKLGICRSAEFFDLAGS